MCWGGGSCGLLLLTEKFRVPATRLSDYNTSCDQPPPHVVLRGQNELLPVTIGPGEVIPATCRVHLRPTRTSLASPRPPRSRSASTSQKTRRSPSRHPEDPTWSSAVKTSSFPSPSDPARSSPQHVVFTSALTYENHHRRQTTEPVSFPIGDIPDRF